MEEARALVRAAAEDGGPEGARRGDRRELPRIGPLLPRPDAPGGRRAPGAAAEPLRPLLRLPRPARAPALPVEPGRPRAGRVAPPFPFVLRRAQGEAAPGREEPRGRRRRAPRPPPRRRPLGRRAAAWPLPRRPRAEGGARDVPEASRGDARENPRRERPPPRRLGAPVALREGRAVRRGALGGLPRRPGAGLGGDLARALALGVLARARDRGRANRRARSRGSRRPLAVLDADRRDVAGPRTPRPGGRGVPQDPRRLVQGPRDDPGDGDRLLGLRPLRRGSRRPFGRPGTHRQARPPRLRGGSPEGGAARPRRRDLRVRRGTRRRRGRRLALPPAAREARGPGCGPRPPPLPDRPARPGTTRRRDRPRLVPPARRPRLDLDDGVGRLDGPAERPGGPHRARLPPRGDEPCRAAGNGRRRRSPLEEDARDDTPGDEPHSPLLGANLVGLSRERAVGRLRRGHYPRKPSPGPRGRAPPDGGGAYPERGRPSRLAPRARTRRRREGGLGPAPPARRRSPRRRDEAPHPRRPRPLPRVGGRRRRRRLPRRHAPLPLVPRPPRGPGRVPLPGPARRRGPRRPRGGGPARGRGPQGAPDRAPRQRVALPEGPRACPQGRREAPLLQPRAASPRERSRPLGPPRLAGGRHARPDRVREDGEPESSRAPEAGPLGRARRGGPGRREARGRRRPLHRGAQPPDRPRLAPRGVPPRRPRAEGRRPPRLLPEAARAQPAGRAMGRRRPRDPRVPGRPRRRRRRRARGRIRRAGTRGADARDGRAPRAPGALPRSRRLPRRLGEDPPRGRGCRFVARRPSTSAPGTSERRSPSTAPPSPPSSPPAPRTPRKKRGAGRPAPRVATSASAAPTPRGSSPLPAATPRGSSRFPSATPSEPRSRCGPGPSRVSSPGSPATRSSSRRPGGRSRASRFPSRGRRSRRTSWPESSVPTGASTTPPWRAFTPTPNRRASRASTRRFPGDCSRPFRRRRRSGEAIRRKRSSPACVPSSGRSRRTARTASASSAPISTPTG